MANAKTIKNVIITLSCSILIAACGGNAPKSQVKSEYPSDYTWNHVCSTDGPVKVCRSYNYGGVYLDLEYSGFLVDEIQKADDKFEVLATVHYKNGDRQGKFVADTHWLVFEREHHVGVPNTVRFRLTTGCLVGQLGGCATEATPEMKDLLYWAFRPDGRPNAIDIEYAFLANGKWDSKYGANYKFHFDQ